MPNTKGKILAMFGGSMDPMEVASRLSDNELETLLDEMLSPLPLPKESERMTMSKFLYAGAARFDRWVVPSPYVVTDAHGDRFKKFLGALRRSERGDVTNCAVFGLHVIKNEIFRCFDGRSVNVISLEEIEQVRQRVMQVKAPSHSTRWEEFAAAKSEIEAILLGLQDKSLRTHLSTRIPYLVVRQPTEVRASWRGLPMVVHLTPEFRPAEESMVTAGNGVLGSVGASRWQTGVSHVHVEVQALIDGSVYTEGLQAISGHSLPIDGWPQSFTFTFHVIHDLVWQLRERHSGLQDWIPAPRDLSDVDFHIETSAAPQLAFMRKSSPAALMQLFVPSSDVATIDLGEIQSLPWPAECRVRATMYLELGDTNEALFWLNVAVEALMAQRFEKIEHVTGMVGLAERLGSPREFWAHAEDVVAKQFPQMAGKVTWPTIPIHVSVFGKLKVLYRLVQMRTKLDELLERYRKVSGNRNDLFHGKSTDRTAVKDVLVAIDALSWIDENMWPESSFIATEADP